LANGTTRRARRKLHLEIDAETGQIVASVLTGKEITMASWSVGCSTNSAGDQPRSPLTAYDQDGVYAVVAEHQHEASVIVPPRAWRC
jgi:hypothetical protein